MKTIDIAIIGGGSVAVSFICQLNKNVDHTRTISIVIFEQSSNYGSGYAYNNRNTRLLLNTPADTMSVLPDEPYRFSKWLRSYGINDFSGFVPRYSFGDYLASELKFVVEHTNKLSIKIIEDTVTNCICYENHCVIVLKNYNFAAQKVIFCHGGVKVPTFKQFEKNYNYITDIYKDDIDLSIIPPNSRALILGSNLSMVDALLLLDQLDIDVSITATSRKAYFPCIKPATIDHVAGKYLLRQMDNLINGYSNISANLLTDFLNHQFTLFLGAPYTLGTKIKIYNEKLKRYLNQDLVHEDYENNKLTQIYPYIDLSIDKAWKHLIESEKQKFSHVSDYLIRIISGINEVNFKKLNSIISTSKLCLEKLLYIGIRDNKYNACFASDNKLKIFDYIIDCNGIKGYYHPNNECLLAKNIINNKQIKITNTYRISIDSCARVFNQTSVYSHIYALGAAGESGDFIKNSFPFYVKQVNLAINSLCNNYKEVFR